MKNLLINDTKFSFLRIFSGSNPIFTGLVYQRWRQHLMRNSFPFYAGLAHVPLSKKLEIYHY